MTSTNTFIVNNFVCRHCCGDSNNFCFSCVALQVDKSRWHCERQSLHNYNTYIIVQVQYDTCSEIYPDMLIISPSPSYDNLTLTVAAEKVLNVLENNFKKTGKLGKCGVYSCLAQLRQYLKLPFILVTVESLFEKKILPALHNDFLNILKILLCEHPKISQIA